MKPSAIKQVAFVALCAACFLLLLVQDFGGPDRHQTDTTGAGEQPESSPGRPSKTASFKPSRLIAGELLAASFQESKFQAELNSTRLLNLQNLSYPMEPRWFKQQQQWDLTRPSLLIVINSKWSNRERRHQLRSSWLNERSFEQTRRRLAAFAQIRHLIVVGQPNHTEADRWLAQEASAHGDLLQVSLRENYRSLSLKHLAIIKWLARNFAATDHRRLLVLKCDDDAQVDLEQLLSFYLERRQELPDGWLMCARFPEHTRVLREPARKWRLSRKEFAFDTFPAYCSGLAYLAPVRLLSQLLVVAYETQRQPDGRFLEPLWVDDVYVTGVLVASMANQPQVVETNGRFCYTRTQELMLRRLNATCMISEVGLTSTNRELNR